MKASKRRPAQSSDSMPALCPQGPKSKIQRIFCFNRKQEKQADGQAGRQTNIENIDKITQKLIYKILNKMPKMEKVKKCQHIIPSTPSLQAQGYEEEGRRSKILKEK